MNDNLKNQVSSLNDYQSATATTANEALSTPHNKDGLINCALGLTGEAGEFADAIKKHIFHGHPLDTDHLNKELGDILFYLARAAALLNLDLDRVANTNLKKLRNRYPKGFSQSDSINRTDSN
ncbi:MazG nucleotide pyrophosphohydrolase domain protein [Poriferisphaera corsica]|uniref:MazG nucleotide pyrophosphohydrolase domain protein n=1 Tax=Poriferisphaera corsica TaxID=2528020 RepID=A0A517YTS2_9BACT|nr:nucleoside triphosphate pyrophosphohydrolase family protein [Poriferisphaera corsica]QDU33582.1 MazG nucleotide pyrophosphohydrolase domain protein [Poriferisphaera corsica]